MLLIAGLGNPGSRHASEPPQYRLHGGGRDCTAAIISGPGRRSSRPRSPKAGSPAEKVLLVKPQTYMNLSGQAVGEAMRFYKIPLSDLTVLYDELDLFPGKVRIKVGGGSGGHNGIRSIEAHCGNEFRRVRLGIGHPGSKELVHNWVLGDFAKADGSPLGRAASVGDRRQCGSSGQGRRQRLHEPGEPRPTRRSRRSSRTRRQAEGPEPHPAGASVRASGQTARKRPDGRHAEEALRQGGIARFTSRPLS